MPGGKLPVPSKAGSAEAVNRVLRIAWQKSLALACLAAVTRKQKCALFFLSVIHPLDQASSESDPSFSTHT